ncbi:XRE family transcriptional regulator, partial [Pseudomonas sp. MWU12-2534b]
MSENSIGNRLKEERMRIGMSQAEFAALGGLGKQAQLN